MNEHELRLGRKPLGSNPVTGRQLYGTIARCACGWRYESNETPSKGGNSVCMAAHRDHVAAERTRVVSHG